MCVYASDIFNLELRLVFTSDVFGLLLIRDNKMVVRMLDATIFNFYNLTNYLLC